ncbi:hypothetical protein [Nocardiopsis trehalosi]|uniref:hypothetical protein n=1 Tax=Nocardiopsis trehalosi TaxID=109329 RepID=UPI00082EE1BF|nr:hypothetical protein [Nocardiopsis trehalosi]
MNDILLILTGGGISLVSSVAVTLLLARRLRRDELRTATRESTRRLTGLFIAERDAPHTGAGPSPSLAEAEVMAVAIADRRTRDRMHAVIRLLREVGLPELEELSGTRATPARRLLCDHALEVLGTHFRGERLPALPAQVQKMLDVEDEALNIHAGATPRAAVGAAPAEAPAAVSATAPAAAPAAPPTAPADAPDDAPAPRAASRRRGKAAAGEATPKARGRSRKADPEDDDEENVDSTFWNAD